MPSPRLPPNKMPTLRSAIRYYPPRLVVAASDAAIRTTRIGIKNAAPRVGHGGMGLHLAPLSAKGGTLGAAASDIGLVNDDASCHDENDAPNNASPPRGGSPTKRGIKRKSPSRAGLVLCPSTPPSPPALRPMRRITASPPPECSGISNGFFGQALTFAARSMQHTVNQLQRWAKEPDLGMKSFASSILSTSWSICLPYQGMIMDRTSDSHEGFVLGREPSHP